MLASRRNAKEIIHTLFKRRGKLYNRSGRGSDSELNHVTRTVPPKSETIRNDFVSQVSRLGCLLPHNFARLLVFSESEKDRLTEAVIARPLREFDLANHRRSDPMATFHFGGA